MDACPNCGTNITDPTAQFCSSCGATISPISSSQPMSASSPPPYSSLPPYGTVPPARGPRPTGITILAILEIIGGLALLFGGAALALLGTISGASPVFAGLGGAFVIFGLLSFVVAFGLWTGKRWAWLVAVILSGLGILLGIVSIAVGSNGSIVGIVIDLIIIYYLTRPHVRVYFGK